MEFGSIEINPTSDIVARIGTSKPNLNSIGYEIRNDKSNFH